MERAKSNETNKKYVRTAVHNRKQMPKTIVHLDCCLLVLTRPSGVVPLVSSDGAVRVPVIFGHRCFLERIEWASHARPESIWVFPKDCWGRGAVAGDSFVENVDVVGVGPTATGDPKPGWPAICWTPGCRLPPEPPFCFLSSWDCAKWSLYAKFVLQFS